MIFHIKNGDEQPERDVKVSLEDENEARYLNIVVFEPRYYLLVAKLALFRSFNITS
jgi:hypothetical protein